MLNVAYIYQSVIHWNEVDYTIQIRDDRYTYLSRIECNPYSTHEIYGKYFDRLVSVNVDSLFSTKHGHKVEPRYHIHDDCIRIRKMRGYSIYINIFLSNSVYVKK